MAEKQELEFPKATGRILVQLEPHRIGTDLTLLQARLLVNRVLAQLNRAGQKK